MYRALPSSEYYEGLRLLPGASAALRTNLSGWAYALARDPGRSPGYLYYLAFRHATVLDPAEVSDALAISSTYLCLPAIWTPSALGLKVTRLNPLALTGGGLDVALPTLTRQPRDCRAKARFSVSG